MSMPTDPKDKRIEELERDLKEMREALAEVVRISDRKHNAWDRAHAILAKTGGKR